MKRSWKALVGVLISVGLLWWVFRGEDPALIWSRLRAADLVLLGLAVLVTTFGFLIRAFRWKVLLHPLKPDTGLRSRFASVSVGFMVNNLLPFRVGEFARAYALSRLEPVTASGAFASLVVERFLDTLVLMGLFFLALLLPSFPDGVLVTDGPMSSGIRWATLALGVVVVSLVALLFWPGPLTGLIHKIVDPLPHTISEPVLGALESFLEGLQILRSPRLMSVALAWTVTFWVWNSFSFWLGFRAFGIDVGFGPALLTQAVVAFGVAVPAAPGFFGTFHAAALVALSGIYGVARPLAVAFAVGYHLAGFVPITLIGLWYLYRIGLTMGEVHRAERRVEADEPSPLVSGGREDQS